MILLYGGGGGPGAGEIPMDLCKARTIKCVCLSLRNGPENICVEIKKAFRSMHIYITSKIENDIQTARKRFEELRKNH